jgi:Root hair defective 3 GTP-binding protein (RHD3)
MAKTHLLSSSLTCCAQDFERKSALFSLASSEILIVNLWEHQVGLYQGANMGLLKTVFEVNLGLFGKKSTDGYVPDHYFLFKLVFETDLRVGQADEHFYSSSFVTILDELL